MGACGSSKNDYIRDDPKMPTLCSGISECNALGQLKNVLQKWTNNDIIVDDMHTIFNHYTHLLQYHDNDDDFEYIYNIFGGFCDMNECNMFTRNYRNRIIDNDNENKSISLLTTRCQIMDKIHCYYQHTFDIGYRFTKTERNIIKGNGIKYDDDGKLAEKNPFSYGTVITINQILSNKNKKCECIDRLNKRLSTKYNQLNNYNDDNKIKNKEKYSFGVKFVYSPESNDEYDILNFQDEFNINDIDDDITVYPKYGSLKQELIENKIATINIEQFKTEYEKSEIHFNSYYRKAYLHGSLALTHILSVMIYCNYDVLQYEFSKTYRKNVNDHNNFYYLGLYINAAVNYFGDDIVTRYYDDRFYHGIGDKLLFPAYLLNVYVLCPLSTSTSFNVAANFTNFNKGLVIEFGTDEINEDCGDSKCFSASWLSDYANEKELLFIQNVKPLIINNITDIGSGMEYIKILNALKMINSLCMSSIDEDDTKISDSMFEIIKAIISNQLSYKFPTKYERFQSLDNYGKQMINTYCQNKKKMWIIVSAKQKYVSLLNVFMDSVYQWIKIDVIHALFPNLETIAVANAKLCASVLDDMVLYLGGNHIKLREIKILLPSKNSKISIPNVISKYKQRFKSNNLILQKEYESNQLYIRKAYQ